MNFSLESLYSWYRSMIRNPQYRWWIVLGTLAYLWSPIDLLPDIFPIIGWIDDGLLATLLVSEISQLVLSRLKLKTDGKQAVKPIVEVVSPD
jgi:uncharacterized membrane protein YkvA (DUF1232 family)